MSFEKRGFLSAELDNWKSTARKAFPVYLELCDEISDLCQEVLNGMTTLPRSTKNILVATFLIRLVQFVQGAIVLIERGMITSARTLLRAGFETLFFLGAAAQKDNFIEIAMGDYTHHLTKFFRMQIALAQREENPEQFDDAVASMQHAIDDTVSLGFDRKEAGIEAMAKLAGMGKAYDMYYRGLSTDAAHTNLHSTKDHHAFDAEGRKVGLLNGPGLGDYADTLYTTFLLAITAVQQIDFLIPNNPFKVRMDALWERFEAHADKPLKNEGKSHS